MSIDIKDLLLISKDSPFNARSFSIYMPEKYGDMFSLCTWKNGKLWQLITQPRLYTLSQQKYEGKKSRLKELKGNLEVI